MKVFAVKVFFQKTNCSNSNIKLFIAFGKYLIAFNAFLVTYKLHEKKNF